MGAGNGSCCMHKSNECISQCSVPRIFFCQLIIITDRGATCWCCQAKGCKIAQACSTDPCWPAMRWQMSFPGYVSLIQLMSMIAYSNVYLGQGGMAKEAHNLQAALDPECAMLTSWPLGSWHCLSVHTCAEQQPTSPLSCWKL